MKGKKGRSAAARRGREAATATSELLAKIAQETEALAAATADADQVRSLQVELDRLATRRDNAVVHDLRRLEVVVDALEVAVLTEERHANRIREAWSGIVGLMIAANRGGHEGAEEVYRRLGVLGESGVLYDENQQGLSASAVTRIQRARGQRHSVVDRDRVESSELAWLRPSTDRSVAERGAVGSDEDRALRMAGSSPFVGTRDNIWAWEAIGLVTLHGVEVDESLGLIDEPDEWLAARPGHSAVANAAGEAGADDGRRLQAQRRWHNPLQASPQFPRPADTAALRWWYWRAAAGRATGLAEATATEDEDFSRKLADDNEFELDPATSWEAAWMHTASMVRSSLPFWLPPGQTANYLNSDPLPPEDQADLRLPYPRVMIVPAEPLRIEPTARPTEKERPLLAGIDLAARRAGISTGRKASDQLDFLCKQGDLTLGRAVQLFGAEIEAVVLESDGAGKPTDRLVWCLSVPTLDRSAVLCRFALPALRSRSRRHDLLDQLAAVAAWGKWGEHDVDDEFITSPKDTNAFRRQPQTVRILDVALTTSEPTAPAVASGRTLPPHLRRGHWRRQHYGTANKLTKRVRIHPVLVNASAGPLAPQVYRLPRLDEPAAEPESKRPGRA